MNSFKPLKQQPLHIIIFFKAGLMCLIKSANKWFTILLMMKEGSGYWMGHFFHSLAVHPLQVVSSTTTAKCGIILNWLSYTLLSLIFSSLSLSLSLFLFLFTHLLIIHTTIQIFTTWATFLFALLLNYKPCLQMMTSPQRQTCLIITVSSAYQSPFCQTQTCPCIV